MRRMTGVAKNLTACSTSLHRGKYDEITDRADAPLADALAMLVRERLTGMPPPAAAKKLVDLWRPLIETKAGNPLDRLDEVIEDQRKFADIVHDLLDALELGDRQDADQDDDQDENEEGEQDQSGADGTPDGDSQQEMAAEQVEASSEETAESAEAAQSQASDTFEDGDVGEDEQPGDTTRPPSRPGRAVPVCHARAAQAEVVREISDHEELGGCAAISTSSSRTAGHCSTPPAVCSAA